MSDSADPGPYEAIRSLPKSLHEKYNRAFAYHLISHYISRLRKKLTTFVLPPGARGWKSSAKRLTVVSRSGPVFIVSSGISPPTGISTGVRYTIAERFIRNE